MRALLLVLLLAGCDSVFGIDNVTIVDAPVGIDAYLPEHAVAYVTFDDGTFADAAGQPATCQTCPGTTTGKLGKAAEFTKTNQQLVLEQRANLETMSAYTVAFWYQLESLPVTESCSVQKVYGAADNSWQMCVNAGGVAHYYVRSASGEKDLIGPALSTQAWHHIAMVWDGVGATLYVDGAVTAAQLATDVVFDGGLVTIGADTDNGTPVAAPDGLIDDVAIYDVALSSAQIQALANP